MNVLVAGVAGSQIGTTWFITGQAPDAEESWPAWSDGLQVKADLLWLKLPEDSEVAGSFATCVEHLDADGAQYGSGSPVVCHVLNMEGNTATGAALHLLTAEEWAALGDTVPGTLVSDAVIDAAKLGLGGEVADEEEAAEEAFQDDDWGDEETDEFADDVEDAADDTGDALEDAAEDTGAALEEVGNEIAAGLDEAAQASGEWLEAAGKDIAAAFEKAFTPDATMTWWLPAEAEEYTGMHRYGAGQKVQAYSVAAGEEGGLTATAQGLVVGLMGANALAAGALALGTITLAM